MFDGGNMMLGYHVIGGGNMMGGNMVGGNMMGRMGMKLNHYSILMPMIIVTNMTIMICNYFILILLLITLIIILC